MGRRKKHDDNTPSIIFKIPKETFDAFGIYLGKKKETYGSLLIPYIETLIKEEN